MTSNDSFEQEIKKYFNQNTIKFLDGSSSYDQLDFTILNKNDQPAFHFDAKEKRQNYNVKNWQKIVSQSDSFILDDLAVRKCLAFAPKSGILVRDNLRMKYFFLFYNRSNPHTKNKSQSSNPEKQTGLKRKIAD